MIQHTNASRTDPACHNIAKPKWSGNSPYSNQVVGYLSAAEGFILLAAILVGRIYETAAREKLWRRVIRI
jgi:hypothetical protein